MGCNKEAPKEKSTIMLDVVDVGEACGAPGCTAHDFLPQRCRRCGVALCQRHATDHRCAATNDAPATGAATPATAAPAAVEAKKAKAPRAERNAERRACPVCLQQGKENPVPPVMLPCGARCGYRSCIAHRHHHCLADDVDRARLAAAVTPSAGRRRPWTRAAAAVVAAAAWAGGAASRVWRGVVLRAAWAAWWAVAAPLDDAGRRRLAAALPLVAAVAALWLIGRFG